MDHHRGSFGGRTFPLWLDSEGSRPNVLPGLLEALASRFAIAITGVDVFAYIAALTAHPEYVERFHDDLLTPGLRIPLTASHELFAQGAQVAHAEIDNLTLLTRDAARYRTYFPEVELISP
ncbi:MAG: hypothetical protein MSC31_07960 [Solirubrobacteraceae bacterium MAG38_C4-C5]|nr:hypothetical protein [Candidatus Siliceabacter maunaloa]